MIKKIAVENFRIFKDLNEFEIRPITLLTGPNNSGKSSFLKLLDLLKTSVTKNKTLNHLVFNEGSHHLGDFQNNLNFDSVLKFESNSRDHIKVIFNFPMDYFDEDFDLEVVYRPDNDNGTIKSFKIFNENRVLYSIELVEEQKRTIFDDFIHNVECDQMFDFQYIKEMIQILEMKMAKMSHRLIVQQMRVGVVSRYMQLP